MLAVEPVADIAVLGALNSQAFPPELVEPFERFCEETNPVRLYRKHLTPFLSFPIHIFTHKGEWTSGEGQREFELSGTFSIRVDEPIQAGTSGSPIVTEEGKLIGIVSNGIREGSEPLLTLALPVWVSRRTTGRRQVWHPDSKLAKLD